MNKPRKSIEKVKIISIVYTVILQMAPQQSTYQKSLFSKSQEI